MFILHSECRMFFLHSDRFNLTDLLRRVNMILLLFILPDSARRPRLVRSAVGARME